jgi:hypothetical protein
MTDFDSALWTQDDHYSAREDRMLIEQVAEGVEHVVTGLVVTARAAGANLSVDVSPGVAFVAGDDQPNQGFYLIRLLNTVNVPVTAAPSTGSRIDRVVARVNDPQAGGPTGDPTVIEVVAGAPNAGAPAEPPTSVTLATIVRNAGEPTVVQGSITDGRPRSGGRIIVESRAPTASDGVNGDLFARVPA